MIENYFKSTLAPEEMKEEFLTVPPCAMKTEFTAQEIEGIAKRLNTKKAPGPDKLRAEFIKNAPFQPSKKLQIFSILQQQQEISQRQFFTACYTQYKSQGRNKDLQRIYVL